MQYPTVPRGVHRRLGDVLPALALAFPLSLPLALPLALVLGASPARAGPSLGEALPLQRAAGEAPGPPSLAALDSAPGLRLGLSGHPPDVPLPALLGRPLDGYSGLQWQGRDVRLGPARARIGLAWRDGPALGAGSFEGSSLAWPMAGGELYASVQRRRWGPSWTGSLILDAAAPALPGVGWRKPAAAPSAWAPWLGPWNADVFIARLSHPRPQDAMLVGLRLQAMPWSGWEIGLSRTMQWGGQGRPRSLGSFVHALLGIDNEGDDGLGAAGEPGNQLGGVDLRYSHAHRSGLRWRLYGQAIGEDEAGAWPSKYLRSVGADLLWPQARGGSLLWFAEAADTQAGDRPGVAYRHRLYPSGYTQRGRPLGHPLGGDRRLFSTGLQLDQGRFASTLRLHRGRTLDVPRQTLQGLELAGIWQSPGGSRLGLSWLRWRESGLTQRQGQLWWQTAL